MDEKVIKTILWSDAKGLLASLASKNLGRAANKKKPADFSEFIKAYPAVSRRRMLDFLEDIAMRNAFRDVTSEATIAEDCCLFAPETATSLEIILRHLRTLNTGGILKSLWGFLDEDKKAVIHFVKKGKDRWYAEAYFNSPEELSVLHLWSAPDGEKSFLPVTFTSDLSKISAQASAMGAFCLHDYLPRYKGDLLSKKGHKKSSSEKKSESSGRRHDKWDSL